VFDFWKRENKKGWLQLSKTASLFWGIECFIGNNGARISYQVWELIDNSLSAFNHWVFCTVAQ
jgi:hypothetical protein